MKYPKLISGFLIIFFVLLGIMAYSPKKVIGAGVSGCENLNSFSSDLLLKNPVQGSHNAYMEMQTNDQSNNSLNINSNSKLEFFFKYIPRGTSLNSPVPLFVRTHSDLVSAREQLNLVSYSDKFRLQYIFNSDGFNFSILNTDAFDKNCWKHVAVVYRSHSIELYLNGVLQGSVDGMNLTSGNSDQNKLIFGRNLAAVQSQKNGFNGLIDEVRIANIAEDESVVVPLSPYASDENTSLLLHLNCNLEDSASKNNVNIFGQTAFVNPSTTSISFPSLAAGCEQLPTPTPTPHPSPSATPTPTIRVSPTATPTPTPRPFVKTHYCTPSPSQTKNNLPCFSLPTFLTPRSLASQKDSPSVTVKDNAYYREVFTAYDDDGDYLSLNFSFNGVNNKLLALPGNQGSNCNAIPTPTPAPQIRGKVVYTVCGFIPKVSSTLPANQRLINVSYSLNDNHGGIVSGTYQIHFF